jgi:hypothetical protein
MVDSLAEFLRGRAPPVPEHLRGRAPPVFQDDLAPRRMTKQVDSRGSMTSFVIGAPVLSETADSLASGCKKQYHNHAAQGGSWQQTAKDSSMYQSVAMGGQVADADRPHLHANGTRKVSSKRMVAPASAAQNYQARFLNAQSGGLSTVDQRIASFAGSFAGLAPSNR